MDPDVGAIREGDGLDWSALEGCLRDELAVAGPFAVRQFLHGSANLTYLVTFGEQRFVVRRPPFGALAPGAHDMRRESTVLTGLGSTWDKAPRCRLYCDDHAIIGADFLVMDYLEGVVVRHHGVPTALRHHADVACRLGLALAEAVGELHKLDVATNGLVGLGRPDGFAARQVDGWWKRWQLVTCGGVVGTVMETTFERLRRSVPAPQRASVVHGDLKLNNCMFDPEDPDVVLAVLDWDMATVGDPLIDIGTLLNLWPDDGPAGAASAAMVPELQRLTLPSRRDLLHRYVAVSGLQLDEVGWYLAFAAWKSTVIVQQLARRYELGQSADHRLVALARHVPTLASVIEPAWNFSA